MSFDLNVLSSKPVIKAAANMQNDGGSGGNLGYMKRRKEKNKKQEYCSLFSYQNTKDVINFQKENNKTSYFLILLNRLLTLFQNYLINFYFSNKHRP